MQKYEIVHIQESIQKHFEPKLYISLDWVSWRYSGSNSCLCIFLNYALYNAQEMIVQ